MTIMVREFVYGKINIFFNNTDSSIAELRDDNGNNMRIKIGDRLIIANNSPNQAWIDTGEITGFDINNKRIYLDDSLTISPLGEAYMGILAE